MIYSTITGSVNRHS